MDTKWLPEEHIKSGTIDCARRRNAGWHVIAIQNFGLLWEKDKVAWGTPRVRGRLLGVRADGRAASQSIFANKPGSTFSTMSKELRFE